MVTKLKNSKFRDDVDLTPLLAQASFEDLSILAAYITDSGNSRISLDSDTFNALCAATSRGKFEESDWLLIAHEIQLFGGNTILNLVRGQGVSYRVVLEDVASRLKVTYSIEDPVGIIENNILLVLAARAWEKMTDKEKKEMLEAAGLDMSLGVGPAALTAVIAAIKTTGFVAYKFATVLANTIAKQLLGKGLSFATTGSLMKGMSYLAGPLGWAITLMWSAYDLGSPGYRVTVPCVIQLAYMRQKQKIVACPTCDSPNVLTAKFCSECGNKISI